MSTMDAAAKAAFAAETRAPSIIAGSLTPFLLSTIFVFARMYSRGVITRSWGKDDSWIAISWILAVALVAISFLFVHYGSGRHQSTTPLANVIPQLKLALAQRLVYQLVVGTTKISLCFFYLRIFTDKKGQWVSYGVMAFVSVYTIGLFLTSLLGCIPTQDIWSLKPKGRCSGSHGRLIVIYTSGALNILTDFVLLVFVIPRILKLQMAKKQKIALLSVTSMSIIVIIAAVLRMVLSANTQHSKDYSWDGIYIAIWTGVEVNAGLFCASAPAIKPLLRKFAPGLLSSLGGSSSYPQTGKRSYGNGSRFGTDIVSSRRGGKRSDRLELQSATELDDMDRSFRPTKTINTIWRGDKPVQDSESERRVLDGMEGAGNIRKTVSISVSEQKQDGIEENNENDVQKFEHV